MITHYIIHKGVVTNMTYDEYKTIALNAKHGLELLVIMQKHTEFIPDKEICDYFNALVKQEANLDSDYHEEVVLRAEEMG